MFEFLDDRKPRHARFELAVQEVHADRVNRATEQIVVDLDQETLVGIAHVGGVVDRDGGDAAADASAAAEVGDIHVDREDAG